MDLKKIILTILSIYSGSIFCMEQDKKFNTKQNAGVFSEVPTELTTYMMPHVIFQTKNLKQLKEVESLRQACKFLTQIFSDKNIKKSFIEKRDMLLKKTEELQNFLIQNDIKINITNDIQETNEENETALELAVENNNFDVIRELVAMGTDLEIKNEVRPPLLFKNLMYKDGLKTIEFLVNLGANIDAQDMDGNTILMRSIIYYSLADDERYEEIIKFLIRRGASLNIKNLYGKTALDIIDELESEKLTKLIEFCLNNLKSLPVIWDGKCHYVKFEDLNLK